MKSLNELINTEFVITEMKIDKQIIRGREVAVAYIVVNGITYRTYSLRLIDQLRAMELPAKVRLRYQEKVRVIKTYNFELVEAQPQKQQSYQQINQQFSRYKQVYNQFKKHDQ